MPNEKESLKNISQLQKYLKQIRDNKKEGTQFSSKSAASAEDGNIPLLLSAQKYEDNAEVPEFSSRQDIENFIKDSLGEETYGLRSEDRREEMAGRALKFWQRKYVEEVASMRKSSGKEKEPSNKSSGTSKSGESEPGRATTSEAPIDGNLLETHIEPPDKTTFRKNLLSTPDCALNLGYILKNSSIQEMLENARLYHSNPADPRNLYSINQRIIAQTIGQQCVNAGQSSCDMIVYLFGSADSYLPTLLTAKNSGMLQSKEGTSEPIIFMTGAESWESSRNFGIASNLSYPPVLAGIHEGRFDDTVMLRHNDASDKAIGTPFIGRLLAAQKLNGRNVTGMYVSAFDIDSQGDVKYKAPLSGKDDINDNMALWIDTQDGQRYLYMYEKIFLPIEVNDKRTENYPSASIEAGRKINNLQKFLAKANAEHSIVGLRKAWPPTLVNKTTHPNMYEFSSRLLAIPPSSMKMIISDMDEPWPSLENWKQQRIETEPFATAFGYGYGHAENGALFIGVPEKHPEIHIDFKQAYPHKQLAPEGREQMEANLPASLQNKRALERAFTKNQKSGLDVPEEPSTPSTAPPPFPLEPSLDHQDTAEQKDEVQIREGQEWKANPAALKFLEGGNLKRDQKHPNLALLTPTGENDPRVRLPIQMLPPHKTITSEKRDEYLDSNDGLHVAKFRVYKNKITECKFTNQKNPVQLEQVSEEQSDRKLGGSAQSLKRVDMSSGSRIGVSSTRTTTPKIGGMMPPSSKEKHERLGR